MRYDFVQIASSPDVELVTSHEGLMQQLHPGLPPPCTALSKSWPPVNHTVLKTPRALTAAGVLEQLARLQGVCILVVAVAVLACHQSAATNDLDLF
jgi:hypothetical protein